MKSKYSYENKKIKKKLVKSKGLLTAIVTFEGEAADVGVPAAVAEILEVETAGLPMARLWGVT